MTADYLSRAELWLGITTLIYFMMNGAGLFETAVLVPKWTAAPPDSFRLFEGKYGLDLKSFWITIHSIHEITFILAIVFCWQLTDIRNGLLILFALHFAVRVWTLAYFAPNIIAFQKIANSGEYVPNLQKRATLWKRLNYVRMGVFIAISMGFIPLLKQLNDLR
jgi:hypothetical protein